MYPQVSRLDKQNSFRASHDGLPETFLLAQKRNGSHQQNAGCFHCRLPFTVEPLLCVQGPGRCAFQLESARGMSGWQFRNPECLSDPHLVAALASYAFCIVVNAGELDPEFVHD